MAEGRAGAEARPVGVALLGAVLAWFCGRRGSEPPASGLPEETVLPVAVAACHVGSRAPKWAVWCVCSRGVYVCVCVCVCVSLCAVCVSVCECECVPVQWLRVRVG